MNYRCIVYDKEKDKTRKLSIESTSEDECRARAAERNLMLISAARKKAWTNIFRKKGRRNP